MMKPILTVKKVLCFQKIKTPFLKMMKDFFFLTSLHDMWDFSSPTRDWTHTPCIGSAET